MCDMRANIFELLTQQMPVLALSVANADAELLVQLGSRVPAR
jgi:hypothetical protein